MKTRRNLVIRTLVSVITMALGTAASADTAGATIAPELVKVVPSDALLAGQVQDLSLIHI